MVNGVYGIVNFRHGHKVDGIASKTYKSWSCMLQRCCNPNNGGYKDYGGRGITVCEERKQSFSNFLLDMGECPEGLTLGRIDNNGNYCKENCEWQTMEKQQNNTRHNRLLVLNGVTHTLMEWSRITGLPKGRIHNRLYRGWTVERALTQRIMKREEW